MKRMRGLVALLLLLAGVAAAGAQDAPAGCEVDGLRTLIADALATSEGQDGGAFMDVLTGLATRIYTARAACDGLVFSDTQARVLGPIELPPGFYRAVVTTEGFFIAQATLMEGECEVGFSLFNLSQGQAVSGAETLVRSEGCRILVETSNITTSWELRFELVG